MSDLKKGLEDQILSKGDRDDLRDYLRSKPLDNNLQVQELESKGENLKATASFLQFSKKGAQTDMPKQKEEISEDLAFASKIPKNLRANMRVESPLKFPKSLVHQDVEENFTIPSKDEFIEENQQTSLKEPLFGMNVDALRFSKPLNKAENNLKLAQDKLKNSQEHLQKTIDDLKESMANSESVKQGNSPEDLRASYDSKEQELKLEEPFSQDELVVDADKIPVMPTLRDEEVPNRPGAILMHARELLGLSIREVAEKLQLRVNTVNDIEHDRLNQPTAVSFVSVYIGNYARLVNIDPQTLIDLYLQNVEENSQKSINKNRAPRRFQIKRSFVYTIIGVIVFVAISGIAYKFLAVDKPVENSSGELVLASTNSPKTSALSGSLTLNDSAQSNVQNIQADSVQRIDPNTQMALAQAKALAQNEANLEKNSQIIEDNFSDVDVPLTIPGVEVDSGNQFAPQKQVSSSEPDFAAIKQAALNDAQNADKTSSLEQKLEERKASESKNIIAKENAKEPKEENSAVKEDKNEVSLSSNLKDISSSAFLTGREGLASMNNVRISVKGDVALKITDNRGRVLKQGVFKAGDNISVSGIPPLAIQVSDSTKINIRYMGGRVNVPSSKQVSFTLPTK